MSRMDNIYNMFVNTENYEDFPTTQEARDQLYEYLENNDLKEFDFEPYFTSVSSANMRQGFIYGFRYAVDLLVGRDIHEIPH